MEINANKSTPDHMILKITGSVDMSTCMALRDSLQECIKKKTKNIVLDYENVNYMDSSGLATLVEAYQLLMGGGGHLKLINLKPAVKELIRLAKMDQIFKIFDTLEDAIK